MNAIFDRIAFTFWCHHRGDLYINISQCNSIKLCIHLKKYKQSSEGNMAIAPGLPWTNNLHDPALFLSVVTPLGRPTAQKTDFHWLIVLVFD